MAYIIHLYIYYTLHKKVFVYKIIVFKLMRFAGLASWHAVLLFDMFSPHECPQCKRSNVEPGCPCDAVLCLDCCVLCRFRRLYQLHRKRRLPFVIAHLIDQFRFGSMRYTSLEVLQIQHIASFGGADSADPMYRLFLLRWRFPGARDLGWYGFMQ